MLRLARLADKVSDWTGKVFSYYLIPLTLILVYEVVARYVVNAPTIWAHEMGGILFAVSSMFAGAYCLRHKAHVNVDVFYSRFSPRGKAIVDIITAPFLGIVCWVLLYYGWREALQSLAYRETSGTLWAPPLYHAKLLIAIALALFVVQVLAKLTHDIYVVVRGKETA